MTRSGNRHLRKLPGVSLGDLRREKKIVGISCSQADAQTSGGQHTLQMLVNLLARQYGVVDEILIDVPDVALVDSAFFPYGKSNGLREALLGMVPYVSGPEISTKLVDGIPDVIPSVSVGPQLASRPGYTIQTAADGWNFACTTAKLTAANGGHASTLGAYMAACFSSGAIFRFLHGQTPEMAISHNLWTGSPEWSPTPSIDAIDVKSVYIIGLGAVGAAFAFALASLKAGSGYLLLIDPQCADDTSRNRLLTTGYEHGSALKVALAEQILAGSGFHVVQYGGLWPECTADMNRQLPPELAIQEKKGNFPWMISCVDRNVERRKIASSMPSQCLGGSTDSLNAQVAYYACSGDDPCLACHHPTPNLPDIEEIRGQLVNMTVSERQNWYEKHDCSPEESAAIEDDLRDPRCGTVGAATLSRLGLEGEIDWSVGFVSVGAGVLLAAEFVKRACGQGSAANETFIWFLSNSLGVSEARLNPSCSICQPYRI